MKTILIISFSDLGRDPRVSRQISFLKDSYNLITIGFGPPSFPVSQHFSARGSLFKSRYRQAIAAVKFLSRKYDSYYWQKNDIVHCLSIMNKVEFDLVIANDIDTLPLAIRGAKGKKVIFDAHEYAPLEFEDKLSFRLTRQGYVSYLCSQYIPYVDAMTTVCDSISEAYRKDTGTSSVVVTNAPKREDLKPRQLLEKEKIKLIHHGVAGASRKLENLIYMMQHLGERFELNLILVEGSKEYISFLKEEAVDRPRINFLEPVAMNEIVDYISQFDIGLSIIPPTNFNYRVCLPNKFFEFIQARLMVLGGPSVEMGRIIEKHNCGLYVENHSPKAMADCLNSLSRKQINEFKDNSEEAADELCAESNKEIFVQLVNQTLKE